MNPHRHYAVDVGVGELKSSLHEILKVMHSLKISFPKLIETNRVAPQTVLCGIG
jgi:hypothetical protein